MTIKELKNLLSEFDENKDAFVALFSKDSIIFSIVSVSDNNGHIQLNITDKEGEEHEERT